MRGKAWNVLPFVSKDGIRDTAVILDRGPLAFQSTQAKKGVVEVAEHDNDKPRTYRAECGRSDVLRAQAGSILGSLSMRFAREAW